MDRAKDVNSRTSGLQTGRTLAACDYMLLTMWSASLSFNDKNSRRHTSSFVTESASSTLVLKSSVMSTPKAYLTFYAE